jgi:hypothetical protein
MLKDMVKIANKLDSMGLTSESDILDRFIEKIAYSEMRSYASTVKPIYVGVMLNNPSDLLDWWNKEVGQTLPKEIAHHMTIKFKPTLDYVNNLPLGEEVQLKVVGWAGDNTIQAVVVVPDIVSSENKIPHITVATDGETSPVKSNALLEAGYNEVDGPIIVGRVGVFDGKKDLFSI